MNYEELKLRIKEIGITPGMTVLIHSSFKSLGLNNISPSQLINAFQEVLTETGNLLFPTLTYKNVNKSNPVFSVKDTPACVGILPETFRNMSGVIRSLNPIHSIAVWGKNAKAITNSHQLDDITLGLNSPLYLMLRYKAKILMLGCGLKPNTFMHLIENLNNIPYRKIVDTVTFTLINYSDETIKKDINLPDMSMFYQRYDRVINILSYPDIEEVSISGETSYLIDANKLLEKASIILKEDPYYFVDRIDK